MNEEIQKEINEGKITEAEINERKNMLLRTPKYQNLISQFNPIEDTPHTELETKYKNMFAILLFIVLIILLRSIRQIDEYERGIKFSLGKFSKIMNPGWNLVFPIFQSFKKVDIRTKAVDVPEQEAITKDNVSVRINAVIYYKVFDASKAILEVENFRYAVSQLAQTTMRNAVGSVTLDELLTERDSIFFSKRLFL